MLSCRHALHLLVASVPTDDPPYTPTLNRHPVLGFASMYPRRLESGAYGDFAKQ
jgi:hypothetical protein